MNLICCYGFYQCVTQAKAAYYHVKKKFFFLFSYQVGTLVAQLIGISHNKLRSKDQILIRAAHFLSRLLHLGVSFGSIATAVPKEKALARTSGRT